MLKTAICGRSQYIRRRFERIASALAGSAVILRRVL